MNYMWNFLEKWRVTAGYVENIRRRIRIMYPSDPIRLRKEVQKQAVKSVIVFLIILVVMCSFELELYWIIGGVFFSISIISLVELSWLGRMNMKILTQLQSFVDDILFAYRCSGSLEEAFWEVLMNSRGLIKLHGQMIYNMITTTSYEENYRRYKLTAPNSFFLLFYAISHQTKQEGDTVINGKSLYVANLTVLTEEISKEILHLQKAKYAFSGLMGMCIIPIFFIKPIELWAESNLPNLISYYESTGGKLCTMAVLICSVVIFKMVISLKYYRHQSRMKSQCVTLICKNKIVTSFINRKIYERYGYYMKLWKLLKRSYSPYNLVEFCVKRGLAAAVIGIIVMLVCLNVGLTWISCLIAVTSGVAGYMYPYLELRLQAFMAKKRVNEELIRLYMVVSMCHRQDSADVHSLILRMELVSDYYEPLLSRLADSYSGSGRDAIYEARGKVEEKGLIRLLDGLLACDDLSIQDALEFVFSEIKYQVNDKNIKEEKQLADRGALARFLAFIPFLATVFIKLIVPFVIEGINELQNFNSTLNLF